MKSAVRRIILLLNRPENLKLYYLI